MMYMMYEKRQKGERGKNVKTKRGTMTQIKQNEEEGKVMIHLLRQSFSVFRDVSWRGMKHQWGKRVE